MRPLFLQARKSAMTYLWGLIGLAAFVLFEFVALMIFVMAFTYVTHVPLDSSLALLVLVIVVIRNLKETK
jgi:hypothetical protein